MTNELPIQFIQKKARIRTIGARIAESGVKLIKNPYVVMCIIDHKFITYESICIPSGGRIHMTLERANQFMRDLRKQYPQNIYYKAKLERCIK